MQNLQKEGEKIGVEKRREGVLLVRQSGENHPPVGENAERASVEKGPQSFSDHISELGLWRIDQDVTFLKNSHSVVYDIYEQCVMNYEMFCIMRQSTRKQL